MACRVLATRSLSGVLWDLPVENEKLIFKQVSYPFFVPQRNDVCAEPPKQKPKNKTKKILANIQIFNNAIKNFRMPKGCVRVH